MLAYITRRLGASVLTLLGASFIVYMLVAYSGDPLEDLRGQNKPNIEELMQSRIALLNLDVPPALRYFTWIGGAAKCVVPFAPCDLGSSISGQPVTAALGSAIPSTLQLVTAATILSIVLGVTVGIITALRQYSVLDYSVTFTTFLFYSLPIFWVAVLLKEFGAIRFNDFLADPVVGTTAIVGISLVVGGIWAMFPKGGWRSRLTAFGIGVVTTAVVLAYLSLSQWFLYPGLGPVVVLVLGVGIAFGVVGLTAGIQHRRALYASIISAVLGVASMVLFSGYLDVVTFWGLVVLGLALLAISGAVGWFSGGYDRGQSVRAAMLTSFLVVLLVVLDRFFEAWPTYMSSSLIRGRPIATIGSQTPGLSGDFWITGLDKYTHLILPTLAIMLISLASYTRYSRSSMLEVMEQDYVRTARAKGVSERVVITRHAFRNALIPIATIVAFDIGGLLGGAVITENVFAIKGMGQLFIQGLKHVDPNPVMGTFLVVGITAVVFNLIADLTYSALDPRVRVKA
jgi:peptide/nickel transport system permease protein